MTFQQFLQQKAACQPAIDWSQGKQFQEIWETCGKPDWLMWLIENLDFPKRTFQELAVSLAESVTHLMRDEKSKQAVVDLRRWLNGENVDLMMVRQSAAYAADAAADAADAAYAADAAAYAADAADAADAAAYADAAAAYTADAADAAADAADIIRNHIPFNEVAQAAIKMGIEL